jgi:hypothetical protein
MRIMRIIGFSTGTLFSSVIKLRFTLWLKSREFRGASPFIPHPASLSIGGIRGSGCLIGLDSLYLPFGKMQEIVVK